MEFQMSWILGFSNFGTNTAIAKTINKKIRVTNQAVNVTG